MSIKHQVTFTCDTCETEYIIDEQTMDMPPGWLGLQVVATDSDGCIPDTEHEVFGHFCSQNCLVEYSSSADMRTRLATVDNGEDTGTEAEAEEDDV